MSNNHLQAASCALLVYRELMGTDDQDTLADLLTDLMHWADANACDFAAELERGRRNYTHELQPQQTW